MRIISERFHNFSKCHEEAMSDLALEMQTIVFDAARPLDPNEGIGARINRAYRRLQQAEPDRELEVLACESGMGGEGGMLGRGGPSGPAQAQRQTAGTRGPIE